MSLSANGVLDVYGRSTLRTMITVTVTRKERPCRQQEKENAKSVP